MEIRHYDDPFQYLTVDNLLTEERVSEITDLAKEELDRFYSSSDSDHSGKYIRWLSQDILPEANFAFKQLPKCSEYSGELKKILHWCICPSSWTSSGGKPHLDHHSRIHTTTFYVSPQENCGTMLCKNDADSDDEICEFGRDKYDKHSSRNGAPLSKLDNEYEVEVPWEPNKLFAFNTLPKTWHYYMTRGNLPRITLQSFFVDRSKVNPNTDQFQFKDQYIDLDPDLYVRTTL